MTILSDYQKYQTEKKLRKDNLQKQYSDNQLRQLEQKNRTQSSIPDMSNALKKVRQSKTTISKNYQRLSSSSLVV
tara:strand:- start:188 stop:412 length:225 start_codon:yes stop_codon:yes gene_type:complete